MQRLVLLIWIACHANKWKAAAIIAPSAQVHNSSWELHQSSLGRKKKKNKAHACKAWISPLIVHKPRGSIPARLLAIAWPWIGRSRCRQTLSIFICSAKTKACTLHGIQSAVIPIITKLWEASPAFLSLSCLSLPVSLVLSLLAPDAFPCYVNFPGPIPFFQG